MAELVNPFAPAQVPLVTDCKCCRARSTLVAVMDAARSGLDARAGRSLEALSGQAVYYYRCVDCGFTFTRAFDHWSAQDFARLIYNEDYGRHDPDYLDGSRGLRTAADVIAQFGRYAGQLSVLDWGSGQGSFVAALRQHGFAQVDAYDPFVPSLKTRPEQRYEMVTCFEVIEHVLDPVALVADLAACRAEQGAILISTLWCTQQTIDYGLEHWHYCVPRNGHISLMTPQALLRCAAAAGLTAHSFSAGAHVLFDPVAIPLWLQAVLPKIS
ncbi:MAG: class I SAM-dependent methyltransferase [Pseudomonadota bacterium]